MHGVAWQPVGLDLFSRSTSAVKVLKALLGFPRESHRALASVFGVRPGSTAQRLGTGLLPHDPTFGYLTVVWGSAWCVLVRALLGFANGV